MTVIKKAIKWFFLMLVLLVYVGGIAILITNRDPAAAKQDVWTEEALRLYREDPDAFFAYDSKVSPEYTSNGNFFVSNLVYLQSANQLEITVRFNKSTLSHAKDDFSLDAVPEWDCFSYTLHLEDGTVLENPSYVHFEKTRHHYLRMVFDGAEELRGRKVTLRFGYQRDGDEVPSEYGEIVLLGEGSKFSQHKFRKKDLPEGNCTAGLTVAYDTEENA